MMSTIKMGIIATFLSLVISLLLGFVTRYSRGLIEITKGVPYIVAGLLTAGLTGMNPNSALIAIVMVSWAPLEAPCASLLMEAKAQPYTHLAPILGNQSVASTPLLLVALCAAAIDSSRVSAFAVHYD